MTSSLSINSQVDLHDHEILAIETGPYLYAQQRSGRMLNIDRFAKDLAEQFEAIGLGVEVKVYTTNQDGTYAFEVEINRRLDKPFDYDRQVHEVTNNILSMPDQEEGFINTNKGMKDFLQWEKDMKRFKGHDHGDEEEGHGHSHGHGHHHH